MTLTPEERIAVALEELLRWLKENAEKWVIWLTPTPKR